MCGTAATHLLFLGPALMSFSTETTVNIRRVTTPWISGFATLRRSLVHSVACFLACAYGSPLCGADCDFPLTQVRWAIQSGALLREPRDDSANVGTVSKGAMLAVLPVESGPQHNNYLFVKPIGVTSQKAGWIAAASTSTCLTSDHLSERGWNSTAVSGMPILIQRLPEPQREDWRRLTKALADAESEGVFVPDAYVARAELWTIAGDTSKAIEDFRRAADAALKAGRPPSEQAAYLRLLSAALERLERSPRPAEGSRANDYASAAAHFGAGCRLYWNQSFSEAESHFENAIALNPKDPLYWYFRGLTRRHLGNLSGSQHDVLVGAFLERSHYRGLDIGRALRRVQGPDRAWLDRYRLGDPSQQLLRLELAGVTV
jgi:hypothetical protein